MSNATTLNSSSAGSGPVDAMPAATMEASAANGEPLTAASAPVAASTLNTETSPESALAAYTNWPAGSTATDRGNKPATAVDDSVRVPLAGAMA